jgi:hypothetical protein
LPDLHRAALQAVPAISSRQGLSFLLSPSGILRPKAFLAAAILVYAVGAASHVLTTPRVIATAGPWPFATIQAVLIWLWFTLHSKRLRDAGVGMGLVAGVALLYALSVALLVIVEASFAGAITGQTGDAKAASGLELILLASVIALLLGSAHYDLTSAVVAILLAVEFIPIALAIGTTIWAAMRPSREAQSR